MLRISSCCTETRLAKLVAYNGLRLGDVAFEKRQTITKAKKTKIEDKN